jgi:hypothetical protein
MESIEKQGLEIKEEREGNLFRISTSGPEETGQVIIKICEAFDPNYFVGLYSRETKENPIKAFIDNQEQERPEGAFSIYAGDEKTVVAEVRNGQGDQNLMARLKEMVQKGLGVKI